MKRGRGVARTAMAGLLLLAFLAGCGKSLDELVAEGKKLTDEGNARGAVVVLKTALDKDPNDFAARYELGRAYLSTGHLDLAEKELVKASLQRPGYEDIHFLLARAYLGLGRAAEALDHARKHASLHAGHAESLALAGQALRVLGKEAEAEAQFRQALGVEPKNQTAKLGLAGLAMQRRDFAGAKTLLGEIIASAPTSPVAYHLLATAERMGGNNAAAMAVYDKAIAAFPADAYSLYMSGMMHFFSGSAEKTRAAGKRIQEVAPRQPQGELLEGLASFLEKDYAQAVVRLQKAGGAKDSLAREYFLGLAHFKLGEYELALTQFQRSLDLAPDAATPRLMAAITLLKQNRPQDAEQQARKLLEKDPENAFGYNVLGSSLVARGRFDEGMDALTKATRLDPKLADAHFKKGMLTLSRGGSEADAERELGLAVELAPEVLDTRLILAARQAADNDVPAAVKTLRDGVRGKPEDAAIFYAIAQLEFGRKQAAAAIEAAGRAKKANPKHSGTYFLLASHYAGQGQYAQALKEFEALLAVEPQNAKALIAAGLTCRLMGDETKALEFMEKAQRTDVEGSYRPYLGMLMKKGDRAKALATLDEVLTRRPKDAGALEDKGRLLLEEGKRDEALDSFRKVREISPERSESLLVSAHLKAGEKDKAMAVAEASLARAPEAPLGYLLKALVLESSGDAAGAERALSSGAVRAKDPKPVQLALAGLYERQKAWDRAKGVYRDILKAAPSHVPALISLGALLDVRGEDTEAEALYRKALDVAPGEVAAMNNLASLLADGGRDLDRAFALAARAFRQEPFNPSVMDTMGFVLIRKGKFKEARPLLEKARELMPRHPSVAYHLALAYKGLGEGQRMREVLREALAMGDFPERVAAEKLSRQ